MEQEALLASLPDERRAEFERTLHFLQEHVPAGYEEAVTPKAIVFQIPLGSYARRGRPSGTWH